RLLTTAHTQLGTPNYMAPEQALDARKADIRADIYSLGCTLFFLLTGRPPFGKATPFQESLAHLQESPPLLRELRPDVPPGLADLVQQMLAKVPDQRPQTPWEVAQRLAPFLDEGTAPLKEVPPGLPRKTVRS